MRRIGITGLVAALAWTAATYPVLAAPPNGDVAVELDETTPGLTPEIFRETLGSHGDWLVSARYGDVWRPRVAFGWRPYFYGSWLWTDEGWYWDSDEPFAWAVYHYGRWVHDPAWGWIWVPGYVWAPAWVIWRYGVDAIGWAPLGPGVSVYVTSYPFVDLWWTFVPTVRFVGAPAYKVAYPPREVRHWFRETVPAPPRASPAPPRDGRLPAPPAWGGPARHLVEERMGRAVVPERRAAPVRPAPPAAARVERGRGDAPAPSRGAPALERGDRPVRGRPEVGPPPRPDGRTPGRTQDGGRGARGRGQGRGDDR